MEQFWGTDFGIIPFAMATKAQNVSIEISATKSIKSAIGESNMWEKLLQDIIEKKTKFGRIGIVFDRKNKEAASFCKEIATEKYTYFQKNSRSELKPKISIIQTQVIREMANEGMADSVEFRRIIRKSIRNAKYLHLDSLVFLEGIFAEKTTRKIIAKIAGTQIKCHFVADLLDTKSKNSSTKTFTITTNDELDFTKKRAEEILGKKLKASDVKSI